VRPDGTFSVFAWRLAHNSLPLKSKIEGRGIDLDTGCPMCLWLDEDASHIFIKCKFVKKVWRELQSEQTRLYLALVFSSKDVFFYIWKLDEEVQNKMITTICALYTE
jgi:hypothetical protein